MKVLIEIDDRDAAFGMKVLKSLGFVKKAKPLSKAGAELMSDLTAAAAEVRLHKAGKIQLKSAESLLNEL